MAIYHEDIVDINLESGNTFRSFLKHTIGMADNAANRFGVRVFRDGVAESLSGVSCQGFFQNANGENIALTSYGTISDNVAYVTLPQACYDVEGRFSLAIKLVGGGVTGTMRIIDGTVDNTNTSGAVAPTDSVPTYQEVLSVYEQMEDALEDYDETVEAQNAKIDDLKSAFSGDLADNHYVYYNNMDSKFEAAATDKYPAFSRFGNVFWINGSALTNANQYYKLSEAGSTNRGTAKSTAQNWSKQVPFKAGHTYKAQLTLVSGSYTAAEGSSFDVTIFTSDEGEMNIDLTGPLEFTPTADCTASVIFHTNINIAYSNAFFVFTIQDMTIDLDTVSQTVRGAINELSMGMEVTKNLFPLGNIRYHNGYVSYLFEVPLPAGTYTLTLNTSSDSDSACHIALSSESSYGTRFEEWNNTRNKDNYKTVTVPDQLKAIFIMAATNVTDSAGHTVTVNKAQIEVGSQATEYVPPRTAWDYVARTTANAVKPNTDNNALIVEIMDKLTNYGYCKLAQGTFVVDGIVMPSGSVLEGSGSGTEVILADNAYSYDMGSARTSAEGYGYQRAYDGSTDDPLPAGLYTVTVNVSTTITSPSTSSIRFFSTTAYSSDNTLAIQNVPRDTDYTFTVYLNKTLMSVFALSDHTASSGVPITINKFQMVRENTAIIMGNGCTVKHLSVSGGETDITLSSTLGHRNGIGWFDPDAQYGIIDGCWVHNFDAGGILLQDTKTPTDHGLDIVNCHVYHNNVGLFIRKNSEYHKIANCAFTKNYWGTLNRGGNNLYTGCGFDSNTIGIQIDEDEGSNGGHGGIANCTINHSHDDDGYGLIVRGTGRELITGCNVWYSNILLDSTNGNVINGCEFGNDAEIHVTGGQCSIIANCIMSNSTDNKVVLTNNTAAKVVNCYYRSGTAVEPVTA